MPSNTKEYQLAYYHKNKAKYKKYRDNYKKKHPEYKQVYNAKRCAEYYRKVSRRKLLPTMIAKMETKLAQYKTELAELSK